MNEQHRKYLLLSKIAKYVSKMLKIFGIIPDSDFGFAGDDTVSQTKEEILAPYLNVISAFRTKVRNLAMEKKDVVNTDLLNLTDRLRNDMLPPLGVQLEDSTEFGWKLYKPEELMRQLEEQKAASEENSKKKSTG